MRPRRRRPRLASTPWEVILPLAALALALAWTGAGPGWVV